MTIDAEGDSALPVATAIAQEFSTGGPTPIGILVTIIVITLVIAVVYLPIMLDDKRERHARKRKAECERKFAPLNWPQQRELVRLILSRLAWRKSCPTSVYMLSREVRHHEDLVRAAVVRLENLGLVRVVDRKQPASQARLYAEFDLVQPTHSGLYAHQWQLLSGGLYVAGDYNYVSASNSIVTNNSHISNSFNQNIQDLQRLHAVVGKSGNREAIEMMERFAREVQSKQPRKDVLRLLLQGMERALPTLASMTDLLGRIHQVINSL